MIGVLGGDGIGPFIAKDSRRVLEFMLQDEVKAGKVQIPTIEELDLKQSNTLATY
jgi:isocitrate dehydrogenase (NAD+)